MMLERRGAHSMDRINPLWTSCEPRWRCPTLRDNLAGLLGEA